VGKIIASKTETKYKRTLARRVFFKESEIDQLPVEDTTLPYTEDGEVYLTVKEACQRLGISRQALDGYVERGQVTKYRRTLARRVFSRSLKLIDFWSYAERTIKVGSASKL